MLDKVKFELSSLLDNYSNKKFLVAASGGLDSTTLIYLCNKLNLEFAICHCNFKLRSDESEGDQLFLEKLSQQLNKPFYLKQENAEAYSKLHKISIQEAARTIRYNWFEYCLKKFKYDFVLTAHHANDKIETYLINSFRGTGLKGLVGMPTQRNFILRPLLNFSRAQIHSYAVQNNISWREDKSNNSDKYLRNTLRHHLIPFFKGKGDELFSRFNRTFLHLNRQHTLLGDYITLASKTFIIQNEPTIQLSIGELKKFSNFNLVLQEFLRDFGFKDTISINGIFDAQNGKIIYSEHYQLVKERGFLELFPISNMINSSIEVHLNQLPDQIEFENGKLEFSQDESFKTTTPNIAFFDAHKLPHKLMLRPIKKGDFFYPLGMKGKRKLSDFLKDEKLTNFEKSKIWVLTHEDQIIWVINLRIDDRFKITKSTSTCLKVNFIST